jgi:hypothetical protein
MSPPTDAASAATAAAAAAAAAPSPSHPVFVRQFVPLPSGSGFVHGYWLQANHGREHWYRFEDTPAGWRAQRQWRNWRSGWIGDQQVTGSEPLPGLLLNARPGQADRLRVVSLSQGGGPPWMEEWEQRRRASGRLGELDPPLPSLAFLRDCLLSHYVRVYSGDYLAFCKQQIDASDANTQADLLRDYDKITKQLAVEDLSTGSASAGFVTAVQAAFGGSVPARMPAAARCHHNWAVDWVRALGFADQVHLHDKLLLMGEEFGSCAGGRSGNKNSRVAVWFAEAGRPGQEPEWRAWHARIHFYVEHTFRQRTHRLALLRYHEFDDPPAYTSPLLRSSYAWPAAFDVVRASYRATSTSDLLPVHRFSHRWVPHTRCSNALLGMQDAEAIQQPKPEPALQRQGEAAQRTPLMSAAMMRIDVCPLRMRWH